MGDVEEAALHQFRHVATEEGEQQGADVGAVDVGIGHDHDLVVTDLLDVERAVLLAIADARADGGDQVLDFLVLQRAVEAGFLDVDQFPAQREDRLRPPVAALLGGAAGGVTFDNIKLGFRGIALRAVGELAGQAAAGQGGLADRLARLAGRLPGAGGVERLLDDPFGDRRVLVEELHQSFVDDRRHHAFDLRIHQLALGLRREARARHLDRDHADQTFSDVIAGQGGILVLEDLVCLCVLVDPAG